MRLKTIKMANRVVRVLSVIVMAELSLLVFHYLSTSYKVWHVDISLYGHEILRLSWLVTILYTVAVVLSMIRSRDRKTVLFQSAVDIIVLVYVSIALYIACEPLSKMWLTLAP